MLLRHYLSRVFTQSGLPVRAAVFAWIAGAFSRLGLCLKNGPDRAPARKPRRGPERSRVEFMYGPARGAAFGLTHGFTFCLALCLGLAAWPLAASAENSAALDLVPQRIISDGLELMRLGISNNMCTLTFDDGPSPYTAQLLDTLAAYNIPATFFVVGTQVQRRPDIIKRMLAEGHEVGNHSFSHTALRKQSPQAQQDDLRKLDALLRTLGARPRFVRPPFGYYDHNTINVVQEMDGHIVMWTADSQDWRNYAELDDMLSNMQMLYSGAPLRGVFLFHDTHRLTVERMPEILDALLAAGCRFVTLSEYIDAPMGGEGAPPMLEAKAENPPGAAPASESVVNFALEGRLDAQPGGASKTPPHSAQNPRNAGARTSPPGRPVRTPPPYPPPADAAQPRIPDVSAVLP